MGGEGSKRKKERKGRQTEGATNKFLKKQDPTTCTQEMHFYVTNK